MKVDIDFIGAQKLYLYPLLGLITHVVLIGLISGVNDWLGWIHYMRTYDKCERIPKIEMTAYQKWSCMQAFQYSERLTKRTSGWKEYLMAYALGYFGAILPQDIVDEKSFYRYLTKSPILVVLYMYFSMCGYTLVACSNWWWNYTQQHQRKVDPSPWKIHSVETLRTLAKYTTPRIVYRRGGFVRGDL